MTNEALSELLGKENLVRGYVYPYEGYRREYLFEHSPTNIANFIILHEDNQPIITKYKWMLSRNGYDFSEKFTPLYCKNHLSVI